MSVEAEKPKSRQNIIINIMKSLSVIVTAILILSFSDLFAQPTEGKWMFAGSTSFSFQSVKQKYKLGQLSADAGSSTVFQITPQVGYTILDNMVVGLELGLSSASMGDMDIKQSSFLAGPFIKYYFDVNSPTVYPFVSGALGLGSEKENYEGETYKTNFSAFGLGGGIAIFVKENISLDLGLSYVSKNSKYPDEESKLIQNTILFGVGFVVFL